MYFLTFSSFFPLLPQSSLEELLLWEMFNFMGNCNYICPFIKVFNVRSGQFSPARKNQNQQQSFDALNLCFTKHYFDARSKASLQDVSTQSYWAWRCLGVNHQGVISVKICANIPTNILAPNLSSEEEVCKLSWRQKKKTTANCMK